MRYATAHLTNLPGHLIAAADRMARTANSVAPIVVYEEQSNGLYKMAAALPAYMPEHALGQCRRILESWADGGLLVNGRTMASVSIEEGGDVA